MKLKYRGVSAKTLNVVEHKKVKQAKAKRSPPTNEEIFNPRKMKPLLPQ